MNLILRLLILVKVVLFLLVNETDGKIKTEGGAVTISGSHPVSYITSGKNTGLLFNKDQTRFLNVYTASENGGLSRKLTIIHILNLARVKSTSLKTLLSLKLH